MGHTANTTRSPCRISPSCGRCYASSACGAQTARGEPFHSLCKAFEDGGRLTPITEAQQLQPRPFVSHSVGVDSNNESVRPDDRAHSLLAQFAARLFDAAVFGWRTRVAAVRERSNECAKVGIPWRTGPDGVDPVPVAKSQIRSIASMTLVA
jgi:hypothetical protein